jgi:hypothetical protein
MSAPRVLVTTSSFGAGDARPLELIRAHGLEPVLNPHGRKLTEDEAGRHGRRRGAADRARPGGRRGPKGGVPVRHRP